MSDQPTDRGRSWSAVLMTAVFTLVLVAPIVVLLLVRSGDRPHPPAPGTPTGPPSTTTGIPAAPDGRIALSTLRNATVDIPAWPADNTQGPHGPLRFHDGQVTLPPHENVPGHPPYAMVIVLIGATYGDVDGDGADETIAEFGCLIQGGSKQLVALDRDRSGRVVTLGQVVATTGQVRDIADGSAAVSEGAVRARVGDFQVCCGATTRPRWQTRCYGWNGHRFRQVGGPTGMPPNPEVTQTRVTAGALVLGPARQDGYRYGSVAVTVTHEWGTVPAGVELRFSGDLELVGTPVTTVPVPSVRRFTFRQPASSGVGSLGVSGQAVSVGGRPLREAIAWDNGAAVWCPDRFKLT